MRFSPRRRSRRLVEQAANPRTGPLALRALARTPAIAGDVEEVLRALAANPSSPADVLAVVGERARKPITLDRLTRHPNTTGPVLAEVVATHHRSPYGSLMVNAAEHPNAPVDMFAVWAFVQDPAVRAAVAGHPGTPADLLAAMAERETEPRVCAAICANLNTPEQAAVAAALRL